MIDLTLDEVNEMLALAAEEDDEEEDFSGFEKCQRNTLRKMNHPQKEVLNEFTGTER